jgi:hypothetical protein
LKSPIIRPHAVDQAAVSRGLHIIEHYRDSEAVIHHVQNTFAVFEERFTALASVSSFVVYGNPNAAAREILNGFGAVYLTKFDGFTK